MKLSVWLFGLTCCGVTGFLAGETLAQEQRSDPKSDSSARGDAAPSPVDNLVRFAMPGEPHKLLEKMAGRWTLSVKYRMNSETPVVTSEGTCTRRWILGKRFLLEEFDGGSLGLPFQGFAIYGYDRFEEKYTSAWVDTMSTAITTNLGTCQDGCKVINFVGRHGDPWSGTLRPSRGVTKFIDETRHLLELYEPDARGREYKILEITYTRAQSPD